VNKDLHERLRRGVVTLKVSERAFLYVTKDLNLRRDRPALTKDWNADLQRLGTGYAFEYDRRAARGFADGPPPLPPQLEALRSPPEATEPAAPSGAHPNVPPATESRGGPPVTPPDPQTTGSRPRPQGMRR